MQLILYLNNTKINISSASSNLIASKDDEIDEIDEIDERS